MGCVLLCQQASEEKFLNMEKEGKLPHGTGTHITGSSCRVRAMLVVSGKATWMMKRLSATLHLLIRTCNCYAVVTIEETLLLCNVYE